MKKINIIGLSLFAFIAVGFTTTKVISINEVNAKIATMIAPLNNANSKISISFTSLNTDAQRTLDFGLNSIVWKKGSVNELKLSLNQLEYHYNNGVDPKLSFDLRMELDFIKILTQDGFNSLAQGIGEMAKSLVAEYGRMYGAAITLDSAIDELKKDAKGNILSVRMHFNVLVDLAKLPTGMTPEQVMFTQVQFKAGANPSNIGLVGQVTFNPTYIGYQADQMGLKEYVESILNDNPEVFQEIKSVAWYLDQLATSLVEPQIIH